MQSLTNNFQNHAPVSNESLDKIQNTLTTLGENATGGIWSKFKAHAAKAMTRPGATRQAVGASALILGGLAKAGLLAGIGAALGTTITFPPAAIGVALVGGALFLATGSYKVYQHAKAVAQQKAQDNNKNVRTRDIAFEFVKQTVDNVIFGVPTLLVKFLPGVKDKLEACAEKYEAKQGVKEGALSISEQIGNLKNIQGSITNNINNAKNALQGTIGEAKTKIQNEIKEKAKGILNEKINDLEGELNKLEELKKLTQLKQLAAQDPVSHLKEIGDILGFQDYSQNIFEQVRNAAKENAKKLDNLKESAQDKILNALDNAQNINDLRNISALYLEKAKRAGTEIDLGIDTMLGNINQVIQGKIQEAANNLNIPENLKTVSNVINEYKELQQKIQNTKDALRHLNENKEQIKEGAKTILQEATTKAKEECKEQINAIKDELKQHATHFIEEQKAQIVQIITPEVNGIERIINGAFATLEKTIESTEFGVNSLAELKTHATQKINEFKNLDFIGELNTQVSKFIDSFDFENNTINLDQAFETTTTKINNLTESLAADAAKNFFDAGRQAAKTTAARKVQTTINTVNNQFNSLGLNFEQ